MPRRWIFACIVVVAIGGAALLFHAATKPSADDASQTASTTSSTARDVTSTSTSSARAGSGSAIAPVPPPEARVDLAAAFTASRFEDVRELCGSRETAAAHPFECTVAACKTNRVAEAQRYFVGVAEAERPKVAAECEAAHVKVDPEDLPRRPVRPHVVRGKRVIDD